MTTTNDVVAPDESLPNENIVLRVSDLRIDTVAGEEILHGVSFALARGEILGLVGESGSGKTTAGLACMGHFRSGLKYGSGSVSLWPRGDDTAVEVLDLDEVAVRSLRGSRIAYIPQDPALSLNPAMRVGDQIREVLDIHGFGSSAAEREARISQVLVDVGLPGDKAYQSRWPHQLSGGQQQRIGIAMAFAMYPDVLILDEPTTGLDVSTQAVVLDTIRQMTVANDVAGLYITHDLAVIKDISDRVAVMLRGDLVEEGPAAQVLSRPQHDYTKMLIAAVPDLAGDKTIGEPSGTAVSESEETVATSDSTASRPEDATTLLTEAPLLEVSDVALAYGKAQILDGINLVLEPGECTMLLGESGSGKTTLSRCVAGLNDDYSGAVRLRGVELAKSTRKRTNDQRIGIQYVFQSPFSSLNPRRSIGQSLTVPLEMSGEGTAASRKAIVEEALDSVRLGRSFYHRRPGDLSGGERQRAAIARALVNAPSVLVCDEITSALDVSVQASIIGLLRTLRAERQLAMLFVTHNIALSRHIADNLAVLNKGVIVDYGSADAVLENPQHEYTKSLIADVPTF
ncbi:ABC transporter ATP-binding protein [Brevibacterium casei]|uniref:Peptide/nickel transport system ATP-binding protein n=1 Tax=Brevibacterium casei CIP 102111 TaxID=1255625 RepID=A0A2H1HWL8_9MICO|nr:ABC transporter ATP-binding protein [Brevibacterium casei]QPR38219.1 ABC transporter ATP-binding protein [Brevibacterium casei]QPR42384.1 ABC transporter ATP-binding protein [Brevibacterium casei]SMX67311.1 peptide/nickel transport system ATP-binding protein [Brevibacterium casei CIP 102111]